MILAAGEGRSLGEICRRWGVGIDSAFARERLLPLVSEKGPILPGQLAALLPGDIVDDPADPEDSTPPQIVWSSPSGTSVLDHADSLLAVRLRVSDSSGVVSVRIGGRPAVLDDSLWRCDSIVVPSVDTGWDLAALAWDAQGNRCSTSIRVFRKSRPVAGAPVIRRIDPGSRTGMALPFDTSVIRARWEIVDAQGIDTSSIRIPRATSIRRLDSVWIAEIPVPPTGEEFPITLQVRNLAGIESSDFFVVTRDRDTLPPAVSAHALTRDREVEYDSADATVSWTVTDNGSLDSVWIQDSLVHGDGHVFRRTVGLDVGTNRIEIVAVDSFGNTTRQEISIVRKSDLLPPRLFALQKTDSMILAWPDSSARVAWVVTEEGRVLRVRIDQVEVLGEQGEFAREIGFQLGRNLVRIEATDRAGNTAIDSAVIWRQGPPPVLSPGGGRFIGTVYDTVTAPGADSIECSTDGGRTWTRVNGPMPVAASTTFLARAWHRGVATGASAEFAISKVTLCPGPISWSSFFLKGDSLWATGYNAYGQLGLGDTRNRSRPEFVMAGVASVASGTQHAMVVKMDGSLWAMGRNTDGQLGDGTTQHRSLPVKIMDSVKIASTAGSIQEDYSLIVKMDGSLWGMGGNSAGQLGIATNSRQLTPIKIADNVEAAWCGGAHSVFLTRDGTLWGMGYNEFGQLGDSSSENRDHPIRLLSEVRSASAGGAHTLVMKEDGSVLAMGYNRNGQLGDGTTEDKHYPVRVRAGVSSALAGSTRSLFLDRDGSLFAMGNNTHGELGDGTTLDRTALVPIMSEVEDVQIGIYQTLILKKDGTLWCNGWNNYGQLGTGGITGQSGFVAIPTRLDF